MRSVLSVLVGLGLLASLIFAGIGVLKFFAERLPHSSPGVYLIEPGVAFVPDGEDLVFMLGTKATYFVSVRGDLVWVSTVFYRYSYQVCAGCGLEIQINILGTKIYVQDGDGGMNVYMPLFARVR